VTFVSEKDNLLELVTPKTDIYVVLRPFSGANGLFMRGEVVDTSAWKHTSGLVNRRYIVPFPFGGVMPEEKTFPDGSVRRVITKPQDVIPQEEPPAKRAYNKKS